MKVAGLTTSFMRSVRALALVALAACSPSPPASPSAPVVDAPGSEPLTPESLPIGLRRSVVADEYFWLRAKVLEGDVAPAFAEAYAAMQEIRGELAGDPTAWEDLEVPLGGVARASDLVAAYDKLPAKKDVGGHLVQFRAPAMRLARAIQASEPAFRTGPYRAHEGEIARAAKELAARLVPIEEVVLKAVEHELALSGVDRPIVVTLVGEAPYPGIFAADARGQTIASFVRVRGLEGTDLVETVIHESLHAIDEITVRSPTAMNSLRAALKDRGVDETQIEMAVNTVTFAEAASLVRRFVDTKHKPLGESGFYVLFPPAQAIVEAWTRHIEGEPIESTTEAIAKAVTSP